MKPIILLDLDRTLFDTDRFWNDFAECLAAVSDYSSKQILKAYIDYTADNTKLGYVFYEELMERYNIDHKDVVKIVNLRLKVNNYLYKDAIRLIETLKSHSDIYETSILTFGQEKFQHLKISLCSELKGFKSYITLLPKNEFIKYYLEDRNGFLVDDKRGQDLPEGWVEVNINRSPLKFSINDNKYKKDFFEITDMQELLNII